MGLAPENQCDETFNHETRCPADARSQLAAADDLRRQGKVLRCIPSGNSHGRWRRSLGCKDYGRGQRGAVDSIDTCHPYRLFRERDRERRPV